MKTTINKTKYEDALQKALEKIIADADSYEELIDEAIKKYLKDTMSIDELLDFIN